MLAAPMLPAMKTRILHIAPLLGALAYAVVGIVELAHGGFDQNTNHTINSTAEYVVTAGFAAALLLTAPGYLALGRRFGAVRATQVIAGASLVLSATTWSSVVRGADAGFFDVVAPLCIVAWLGGSIALAVAARRRGASLGFAVALPALVVATVPLAQVGGGLLTAAFWAAQAARPARVTWSTATT